MYILGASTLLSGDEFAICFTPVNPINITKIELMNAEYDEFYAENAEGSPLTPEDEIPQWDYGTELHAQFNGTTAAGNLLWTLDTVDGILIKRSERGKYNWISIDYRKVNSEDDFYISGRDYALGPGYYDYALVPLLGTNEGSYVGFSVEDPVVIDKLTIVDSDEYNSTYVTDGFCNTNYVMPSSVLETLHNKYPTIISNASTCYETIEVSGSFYPDICNQEEGIFDDKTRSEYIKKVLKFLTNGKAKILKNIDGRVWLVWVTTPPSNTAQDFYKFRNISFGCTEIGDIESERDLYYAGFSNVPEMFWNS